VCLISYEASILLKEFGLDFSSRSDIAGGNHLASGERGEELGDAWTRSQAAGNLKRPSETRFRTIAEQEKSDGEDVLAMLSEPSKLYAPFETPEDEEDYDWGLSAEQMSQLRAMTKSLFPPPVPHTAMAPDHPLNLVPQFDKKDTNIGISHSDFHVDEPYMYLGAHAESAAAREMWRVQWEGVLTRYTDEVWGGLLPLVKEARKEIEGFRDDPIGIDQPKALRRLGAILSHLRKN
jgi:hypothetical protein